MKWFLGSADSLFFSIIFFLFKNLKQENADSCGHGCHDLKKKKKSLAICFSFMSTSKISFIFSR